MKKQNTRDVKAHLLRGAFYLLLFVGLVVVVALSAAINMPNPASKFSTWQDNLAFGKVRESASSVAASATRKNQTLTFADRVAYQRAIEEVYWRHRIWPKENPDPKPSLDAVMSQEQLEKKVEDYLRKSQALEDYWQRPITAEQLQAEMDRMAKHTRQPEVLRELFEALGNDPFVIAECLARPALADRLLTNWHAYDERIHGELKQRAEAELVHASIRDMKQLSGQYREIELVKSDNEPGRAVHSVRAAALTSPEWNEAVQKLATAFGVRRDLPALKSADMSAAASAEATVGRHSQNAAAESHEAIPVGKLSPLQEDESRYYATAVISKTDDRIRLATVSWPKEPSESWLARAETQMSIASAASGSNYALPQISGAGCIDDTWTPTAGPADARFFHTAIWTGTEMIVWDGYIGASLNTAGPAKLRSDT